ncbi:BPSS1780 family membrane protein [Cupriavidus sp. D39]|uniref:BPSS1780 family membrane protein n=1 Tax=Cupriavidus sp. D39 TaxID=2997877 RepID=UPI00226ED8EF|nr:BPSS1780 family membrane protein [Cupriavidus sp. D39]MCY0856076.1 BPSS1780 family membrane protein [Cupriavidus sp. D39]
MQLLEVSAKEGYVWFRQGVWLFRKNPLAFLMLLFVYLIAAQLAVFVPLIGIIALLVVTPGLSVGIMTACREVILNKRVLPTVLLAGFRGNGKQASRNLLVLGGIYAGLVFVLSLIAGSLVDISTLVPILLKEEAPSAESVRQLYFALMIGAALYTPIAMLFWFAPLLTAWHNVPPVKALFFSWTACWRNRGAFLAYGVVFAVLLVAVPFFLEALFGALGAEAVLSFLVTPYSLLMLAIMYCSFYATYRGCFNVVPEEATGKTDVAA